MGNDAIERSNLASQIEQAARGAFDGGKLGTLLGGQWTAATVAIETAFHDLGIVFFSDRPHPLRRSALARSLARSAPESKCLAPNNKSQDAGKATKR
jgi:hypothetical protein